MVEEECVHSSLFTVTASYTSYCHHPCVPMTSLLGLTLLLSGLPRSSKNPHLSGSVSKAMFRGKS